MRHHSWVRSFPWAMFFNGVNASKKQAATVRAKRQCRPRLFLGIGTRAGSRGRFFKMSRSMRASAKSLRNRFNSASSSSTVRAPGAAGVFEPLALATQFAKVPLRH